MRDDVYPDLMDYFYANDVSIDNNIKGVSFTLDRNVIQKILGIGFGGELYRDNIPRKEQLNVLYGQDTN